MKINLSGFTKYTIFTLLKGDQGRGAYGTVFLCSNIHTRKEYIMKEIPMESACEDERAGALNEVQILKVRKIMLVDVGKWIVLYFESFGRSTQYILV